MAERLTDQTEKTSGLSFDDVLHIVDVSDTTDNAAGSSYKIKVGNFLRLLGVGVTITGFENYTVKKASGNTDLTTLEVGDLVEGTGAYFSGDYIVATVASVPVSGDGNFNTPLFRASSI